MPIITLEVMSDSFNTDQITTYENYVSESTPTNFEEVESNSTGVHFLSDKTDGNELIPKLENETDEGKDTTSKPRNDFLEYMTRNDGSVICKLCGEILQSRTHWYRHKYKLHVVPPLNPAPLFHCEQCLAYFKSRKGYIGHIASRHSEMLADSRPVLTNTQAEAVSREHSTNTQSPPEVSEEPDPELSIPKSSVPNYQTARTVVKSSEAKRPCRTEKEPPKSPGWEEKRTREEKLVADIIDRVRRECEAQGSSGSSRRGYSRRTTVMHL